MNMGRLFPAIFLVAAVMLWGLCGQAAAEVRRTHFELGIGGGADLNGLGTAQVLLAPAVSIPLHREIVSLRLEGNIEFIHWRGSTMFIGGISPLIRAALPLGKISPFLEMGPGVNYADHVRFADRELGGPFFFSAMGGIGFEIRFDKRDVSISYRVRHISNARLQDHNQGMNSQYIMLSMSF
jgi:hypothetical protein